jgi:hypothetical protein
MTHLGLIVRENFLPLWLKLILESLDKQSVSFQLFRWTGNNLKTEHINYFPIINIGERFYAEPNLKNPIQRVQNEFDAIDIDQYNDFLNCALDKNITHFINLANLDSQMIKSIVPQLKVWAIENLAYNNIEVDFAYLSWKAREPYVAVQLLEIKNESIFYSIGYAVSPAGKLSILKARQAYFAMTGLICRTLEKDDQSERIRIPLSNKTKFSYFKFLKEFIYQKMINRIGNPKWIVAYGFYNGEDLPNVPSKLEVLENEKEMELADPFIYINDGNKIVFAEEIDKLGKGRIVAMELSKRSEKQVIIRSDFHMSYPFIFKWNDQIYLMPESSESSTLSIYKANKFPFEWVKEKDLFVGKQLVDATFIFYIDRYWMFACEKKYASSFNEELHIYYSDNPLGTWKQHHLNPVKNDARNSRPAGGMVIHEGNLYRPVQDCSLSYGKCIHWMKVIQLSENEFEEENVTSINPTWTRSLSATHTINRYENFVVIDGYKF